jgi:DNA-binding NtrC family response regulator
VKRELEVLVGQMIEKGVFYGDAVGEFERTFIKSVLEKNRGNRSRAAKSLGIHRNTLGRKLEELGLNNHHKARKPTAR